MEASWTAPPHLPLQQQLHLPSAEFTVCEHSFALVQHSALSALACLLHILLLYCASYGSNNPHRTG